MSQVASPGHRLGQMIGEFFEALFADDFTALATRLGYYCDKRGTRPARGKSTRIVWRDNRGNDHALDYVIEKDGSATRKGEPIAFIELAWRRYPKHSRNKSGEIAGALLPLRETYSSCRFTGAILAGAYTAGGKSQLISHGITTLHIPFAILAAAFKTYGIDLQYAEAASNEAKREVIEKWESLSACDVDQIRQHLRRAIEGDYRAFIQKLEAALSRRVQDVRILPLFGSELAFASLEDAVSTVERFNESPSPGATFHRYEILLRFTDGDKIEGVFHQKGDALAFLELFL